MRLLTRCGTGEVCLVLDEQGCGHLFLKVTTHLSTHAVHVTLGYIGLLKKPLDRNLLATLPESLHSSSIPLPAAAQREFYSIAQAASLLGVSRVSIWRWIRAGHLPASRIGPRTTRIKRQDLEHLLAERGTARPWSMAFGSSGTGTATAGIATTGPHAGWSATGPSDHFVQFYDADTSLTDAVAGYMATALQVGDAGVVIATPNHREAIEERLWADGLDMDAARARGQYRALDALETLSTFMVDGQPDPARFDQTVGAVLAQSTQGGRHSRLFGEMVALLALDGNHSAAVALEQLWNDLQTRHTFALFCAYPTTSMHGSDLADVLGTVCTQHAHVIPAESYTALPSQDDQFRAIVQWQHKAQALEAALAAELAARKAAEDALRIREEFLSIASHELKTPLTTLSGHTQIALRQLHREGHLEPGRALRSFETIKKQAGKLGRLIDQLLDATRLEAGKLALDRTPTDLASLVHQVVAVSQVVHERHTISVVAPPTLEACVDPLRIEQVLTNLLDNAIKYSPDSVQIDVLLLRNEDGTALLAVRDRGPGIPREHRDRLFERFYQAHADNHQSGMGLGLYISRQIAEQHGGSISAVFPPDGGSRFELHLPLQ
jgi:excisionase family DNA binding protein